ncbi:Transcriptional regulator, TetR family [Candidatus Terasakiella magnetica]|uniref:Transcriptional regulator, TetR family n=1 Tax=Candidatus Terasakiella magnetica TaxID=1867952 RepID=A0A1C3RGR6_9PROT|nr:TetR/AcrR family transcriptional regulator [Candidatus Terasakiella magnetica]SCA56438.1 Transcriptional regulator, TetR family [Candidatus Terasakiella magnetica]
MARPRSFDKNTVLDQVMILFWEKGYGATSMIDIQKATGLKPGSLYDSFGDKHALFQDALSHYRQTIVRKRLDKLMMPGPAKGRLEEFFNDLIEFSLGEGKKLGCLMSNSAIELAPHDAVIKAQVQDNLVEIAETFCGVIEEGIANGEFKTTEPAENIARFLTSTVQGLRVMAKSSTTKETLTTTARLALKILD